MKDILEHKKPSVYPAVFIWWRCPRWGGVRKKLLKTSTSLVAFYFLPQPDPGNRKFEVKTN